MEHPDQADYFLRRAEEERAAADSAADERAAQTHLSLAARYEAMAKGGPVHELIGDGPQETTILPKQFRILP